MILNATGFIDANANSLVSNININTIQACPITS